MGLMGIMAYNWEEIQNLHLLYIGAKTTGKIWISSLIQKFCDTAWDARNYRNYTLHSPDEPTKKECLILTNNRITYNINRGK